MKQVNITLVSAISLMLFSSYVTAGGTTSYEYYCYPIDPAESTYQGKCCVPGVEGDCGAGTIPFSDPDVKGTVKASSGATSGGGKHKLEPNHTKYMDLHCMTEDGYQSRIQGYKVWYQTSKIACTEENWQYKNAWLVSVTLSCHFWGGTEGKKKFGLVFLNCS